MANKRVTRYVVMAGDVREMWDKCDSVFESKENAEKRVNYLQKISGQHQKIWIQTIRFRTPEVK